LLTAQLIQDCKNGDRIAQRDLYLWCYPMLIRIGKRYAKNEENVLEIVTNSYLKILKNLSNIVDELNTEAWVKKIGVHCNRFL
jgi:hypothetical protein